MCQSGCGSARCYILSENRNSQWHSLKFPLCLMIPLLFCSKAKSNKMDEWPRQRIRPNNPCGQSRDLYTCNPCRLSRTMASKQNDWFTLTDAIRKGRWCDFCAEFISSMEYVALAVLKPFFSFFGILLVFGDQRNTWKLFVSVLKCDSDSQWRKGLLLADIWAG